MIIVGMFWKEVIALNLTISMIDLSQHFDSLTIWSSPDNYMIEKLAAYEESQFLIPTPISAYFMARRSFAPSPTIPTLSISTDMILWKRVNSFLALMIVFLRVLTISALFSGEILE